MIQMLIILGHLKLGTKIQKKDGKKALTGIFYSLLFTKHHKRTLSTTARKLHYYFSMGR
jgi:hypothetical protein